jgi:hypothetical protein
LPHWWADLLRGSVRCMFPLASLAALALLLASPQGGDVLRALVGATTDPEAGHAIAGLVFLMAASAVLSASVWYSMRWLLAAQMPGLPLAATGWGQTWLPRLAGAAAPLFVALGLWRLRQGEAGHSALWAAGFAALALFLLGFYAGRGELIVRLRRRGWIHEVQGRTGDANGAGTGRRPSQLGLHESLPNTTLLIMVWSIAITITLGLLFWLFPITLPRVVGAAAVAALALASINLFGSFVLTYAPLRNGLPPLAVVLVLLAGVAFGALNDNHRVQPATQLASAPASPATLDGWLDTAPRDADGRPLLLLVASEGGGIRAAYWTAAVLDRLDAARPALKDQMVALSGVSGGSLGLAAWLASHRAHWCPTTRPGQGVRLGSSGAPTLTAPHALGMDFVAPAVAGMFYADLVQRFLPFKLPRADRAHTIETAWQRAFVHLPDQPLQGALDAFYAGCKPMPHLMLNATRVETGQRVVLTRLPTAEPQTAFINTFDAMAPGSAARTQSLAGLVHHSARFPLVSPAGTVPVEPHTPQQAAAFRLVDGGYFDNSGVQSALDLVLWLRRQPQTGPPVRPVLLLLRNEASWMDCQAPHLGAPSAVFPESSSIALALLNVRGSHAVSARGLALALLGNDVIDLPVQAVPNEAPLGWALSVPARRTLAEQAEQAVQRALPRLDALATGASAAANSGAKKCLPP